MKKYDNVFLTTIFPKSKIYLDDFFKSLQGQLYKDFDVLVVNEAIEDFHLYKTKYKDLNIIEIPASNSPVKNREIGINKAVELEYENLIFGDSDDYFDENRVQICVENLRSFDIVVNDLTLFNIEGVYSNKYITNRLNNNTEINLEYILDKNFLGLSNTAIKVNALIGEVSFDSDLFAVDWYLFSILLSKSKRAVFTNETVTFYRQYSSNTVGIGEASYDSIMNGILVKQKHYELMQRVNSQYKVLLAELIQLKSMVEDKEYLDRLLNRKLKSPLWWEEIKLL